MTTNKDTDLREALRRKYADTPQLPENFSERLMQRIGIVSMAYVFEDNENLNLFDRLLQAACWYDGKTPGYFLNYSYRQFFFCLKDLRLGLKYLWIAERVNGKILLYSTHSPIETDVSSECYQEYRDKLTHTSIHQKTTDL